MGTVENDMTLNLNSDSRLDNPVPEQYRIPEIEALWDKPEEELARWEIELRNLYLAAHGDNDCRMRIDYRVGIMSRQSRPEKAAAVWRLTEELAKRGDEYPLAQGALEAWRRLAAEEGHLPAVWFFVGRLFGLWGSNCHWGIKIVPFTKASNLDDICWVVRLLRRTARLEFKTEVGSLERRQVASLKLTLVLFEVCCWAQVAKCDSLLRHKWLARLTDVVTPAAAEVFAPRDLAQVRSELMTVIKDVGDAPGESAEHDVEVLKSAKEVLELIANVLGEHQQFEATIAVLDRVEPDSRPDHQETLRQYEALTKPMPLVAAPDPMVLRRTLDAEFPWMKSANARIARGVASAWMDKGVFRLRPILLHGGPGIGKTRYARRVAEIAGVSFLSIAVGGSGDNRALRGTARGYSSASPMLPLILILRERKANPLILLDELDKDSHSRRNGRMSDTLHQLIEAENAKHVFDEYLLGHADLSHISWIATANDIRHIEQSLLSRFDVIRVPEPSKEHYPAIVHGVLRDYALRLGLSASQLPTLTDGEWRWLLEQRRSVRSAVRAVEALMGLKIERLMQAPH